MERGVAWEREALRDRWEAMRERREAADRFLRGALATFAGTLLLLLAGARETCVFTIGGATGTCTGVLPPAGMLLLGILGVLALVVGLYVCWTAARRQSD